MRTINTVGMIILVEHFTGYGIWLAIPFTVAILWALLMTIVEVNK